MIAGPVPSPGAPIPAVLVLCSARALRGDLALLVGRAGRRRGSPVPGPRPCATSGRSGPRHLGRRLRLRARLPGRRRPASGDVASRRRHGRARRSDAVPPGRPGRRPHHGVIIDDDSSGAFLRRAHDAGSRSSPGTCRSSTTSPATSPHRRRWRDSSAGRAVRRLALDIECDQSVPDPTTATTGARRARRAGPQGRRRSQPLGAHRADPRAARRGQPRALARVPVQAAREVLRRVVADELLDEPRPAGSATRSSTRPRTSGGCAPPRRQEGRGPPGRRHRRQRAPRTTSAFVRGGERHDAIGGRSTTTTRRRARGRGCASVAFPPPRPRRARPPRHRAPSLAPLP